MRHLDKKITCDHCHLSFDESIMLVQNRDDEKRFFCCKGCQGVYNLLHENGLDNFYDRSKGYTLTPQTTTVEDSAIFDTPVFSENFVKQDGELLEISLIIEGIHCAACVWLNEKILSETEGVVDISINFSTNKAKVVWDPTEVKLSKIIETIRSIGYDAYAYDPKVSETKTSELKKEYHSRLIVAVFAAMNVMWIAIAQYAGIFSGIEMHFKTILNIAEGLLATPVLFYSGWIFFRGAYFGIKNSIVNMDLLVATGASLTYVYSLYITAIQSGEAYFDSVVMIITFVLVGKFLEVSSKKSASDTLDALNRHVPVQIRKLTTDGLVDVNVHDTKIGDILEVHAGERFALDGVVYKDETYVDESSLTGENDPVMKKVGEHLVSGTTNMTHNIQMKVTKTYENSTFSKLLTLLDDALSKKPNIEKLANRISSYFSTVILFLALATFLVWYFPIFSEASSFNVAFMVGISVIVIACPCALALATPIASLVGVSMGAKKGVLFKESAQLETMAKTTKVFFDKTGTLTEGKLSVSKEEYFEDFDKGILASMVYASIHPVSKAIYRHIDLKVEHNYFDSYELVVGKGMKATYKNSTYYGGSAQYLKDIGVTVKDEDSDNTLFFVVHNNKIMARFELSDEVKSGSLELINYLKSRDIEVHMLTGDHLAVANKVAQKLGINHVHASLTPEDKAKYMLTHKKDDDVFVMVGDGINDILVLASADIGIAMGSGADVTIDNSDIVLLQGDMKSLKEAFDIAAQSFHLIKQNLQISLLYNVVTIPLAMGGMVIPLVAALSMSLSSLLVVGNSLRVKAR